MNKPTPPEKTITYEFLQTKDINVDDDKFLSLTELFTEAEFHIPRVDQEVLGILGYWTTEKFDINLFDFTRTKIYVSYVSSWEQLNLTMRFYLKTPVTVENKNYEIDFRIYQEDLARYEQEQRKYEEKVKLLDEQAEKSRQDVIKKSQLCEKLKSFGLTNEELDLLDVKS